ncbi:hypothetical protein SAY87_028037 [Trapa incisa]|uniref:Uncharacterized protein n=1 Tax=Trapa incisa TaxID=236973 RepID=A0AAN7KZ25_9MYRT|nr:hypothetical protein SAY87_028037 [Trapa incisa]
MTRETWIQDITVGLDLEGSDCFSKSPFNFIDCLFTIKNVAAPCGDFTSWTSMLLVINVVFLRQLSSCFSTLRLISNHDTTVFISGAHTVSIIQASPSGL